MALDLRLVTYPGQAVSSFDCFLAHFGGIAKGFPAAPGMPLSPH
jgi:hypothetical protein